MKALEEYGFNINWDILKSKTVIIFGCGGLGGVVAELLARMGIGKLILFDLDKVSIENLNRFVFNENDIGLPKVDVLKKYINLINKDVEVDTYYTDIMGMEIEDKFDDIIKEGDLGMMCLDNVPARQFMNSKSIQNNIPFVEAGLLRSGLGGYVHLVIPFETPCYQCIGSIKVKDTNDTKGEPCSASLPTTVNIVASLQVQHAIKYLLKFGSIPDYVGYDALYDENIIVPLKRDVNCYICG